MKNELIYLDNSSATRLDERVLEEMETYYFDTYAVASSEFGHSIGIEAREALDEARESLASGIGASADELIFTSGGTESSNLALKGAVMGADKEDGGHIITTTIEDFPVLNSAKALKGSGYEVTYLEVDERGFVDHDKLKKSLNENTILVSVQHANQEIGTVQNIKRIGEICQEKEVLFHTDATHTFGRLPLDVNDIPVDLITVSAHTIHGPKGIGGLYIREGTSIQKWMDGGFQEFNLRAGVENIPGAVGFAKASQLITDEENRQLLEMRDYLIDKITEEISETTLNGSWKKRTPQNVNITFHGVEGESITLHLDMRKIAVSTGSACFSRSLEASHVIMGIGGNHERAHGSVRFTLSRYNSMEDMDYVIESVSEVVSELRKISPLSGGDDGGEDNL